MIIFLIILPNQTHEISLRVSECVSAGESVELTYQLGKTVTGDGDQDLLLITHYCIRIFFRQINIISVISCSSWWRRYVPASQRTKTFTK